MTIIQPNGDRHYQTKEGVYVIINWGDGYNDNEPWEIIAPLGWTFGGAHSQMERTLSECKYLIGDIIECEDKLCECWVVLE